VAINDSGPVRRRIVALDGLRAISILFVIIGHLAMNRYGTPPYGDYPNVSIVLSSWGVELFFVISGFIITRLALAEYESTGNFSIGAFYIRRLFRIFPPFYLYLAVVLILAGAGAIVAPRVGILQSATFTCNVTDSQCEWFVRHTWTLAYEEQFYIVFPFIFYLFRRKFNRFIIYLAAFLLLLPTIQNLLHLNGAWHVAALFAPKFAFIAVGSLIATHFGTVRQLAIGRHAAVIWWLVVILLGIWLILNSNFYPIQMKWSYRIGNILLPFCFAWIVGNAASGTGILVRLLSNPVLQFIGTISYSLYIWQQFFTGAWMYYHVNNWFMSFPMMFVVATISYYGVERPFIKLRRRIIDIGIGTRRLALPAKDPGEPQTLGALENR
jgi:peptidoglycan/LPS O-acetylase OafA/YrhL